MNAEVIDIGRYLKVPYDVVIARISHRAFRVWTLIAAGASPENPIAPLRQSTLAEQLGCSTDTIGRAIAELTKHGLLCEAGKWNKGRCKIYRLNWSPSMSKNEEVPKEPALATTALDDLLVAHGESWAREYGCFDGVSGRPSLRACVEEALNHSSKAKISDLKVFIDGWLRISSGRWSESKAPSTENPPGSRSSAQGGPTPFDQGGEETDDERSWIIAQIKSDNERQRLKESLEAKRQASFLARGNPAAKKVAEHRVDKPISRENYPISWAFHKIQWAERMRRNAAA